MNKKSQILGVHPYVVAAVVIIICGIIIAQYFSLIGNTTDAAMSQTRIDGDISIDLRPRTFRSGGPGDRVEYLVILKNLNKKKINKVPQPASTWNIWGEIDPQGASSAPGIDFELESPSHPDAIEHEHKVTRDEYNLHQGTFTLNPQEKIRYVTTVVVSDGAIPGQEVLLTLHVRRPGDQPITVQRYFTVEGGTTRPR